MLALTGTGLACQATMLTFLIQFKVLFIYLQVFQRETEICHPPVYSSGDYNGQAWASLKLVGRCFIWVSYEGTGVQDLGSSSAFSGTLLGAGSEMAKLGLQLAPTWDAHIVEGGLTHCTETLAPAPLPTQGRALSLRSTLEETLAQGQSGELPRLSEETGWDQLQPHPAAQHRWAALFVAFKGTSLVRLFLVSAW